MILRVILIWRRTMTLVWILLPGSMIRRRSSAWVLLMRRLVVLLMRRQIVISSWA